MLKGWRRVTAWTMLAAAVFQLGACAPLETADERYAEAEKAVERTGIEREEEANDVFLTGAEELIQIQEEEVPLYLKPALSMVRQPIAGGSVVYENGRAVIDASNGSEGYVMIRYTGNRDKIKVQISKGGVTYTYDLNARDVYEVFPFSEGNGTYSIKVFENVTGNQYAQVFSQDIQVALVDQFIPFLYPNQYVNFTESSAAVKKGAELAASAADDIGIVRNIYDYVIKHVTYDTAKAASVQSGYLPNVDAILASGTGICFDYAALMTAMLRSQNIPTKLVIGYTGSLYHAWINVYLESVGWVDNMIFFDGQNWSLMDPTFASTGGQNESVRQYIGNGSNYQAKYTY